MRHTTLISALSVALLTLGTSVAANDDVTKIQTPQGDVTVTSGQPTTPPAKDEPHSVAELDTNRDGAITMDEARPSLALTNEFDLADNWNPPKRDGRITASELSTWLARGGNDGGNEPFAGTGAGSVESSTLAETDEDLTDESTTASSSTRTTTSTSTSLDAGQDTEIAEQDDSDLEPSDQMEPGDDEAVNDDELDGDLPDQDEPED